MSMGSGSAKRKTSSTGEENGYGVTYLKHRVCTGLEPAWIKRGAQKALGGFPYETDGDAGRRFSI